MANVMQYLDPEIRKKEKNGELADGIKFTPHFGWFPHILLFMVTLGIFDLFFYSKVSSNINIIASRHDYKNTMHFILAFVIAICTFGIFGLVWFHGISDRIGAELFRRKITYSFSSNSFWGWAFLGSFIFIGPYVYLHKIITAMNCLYEDYNIRGE